MAVSAEELEYILNAVLQKSKCQFPQWTGAPWTGRVATLSGLSQALLLRAWDLLPMADLCADCRNCSHYFLTMKTMQASGGVFYRLFYRKV